MRLRPSTTFTTLPRPNAGWRKIQCILRFTVRLNRARRRARGEVVKSPVVPGLTNAMRAVIVTRVMCLKYEGEEDPYDTLEEFLHETVEANKNARRGGDDDDDDDHVVHPSGGRGKRTDAGGASPNENRVRTARGNRFAPDVKPAPRLTGGASGVAKHASTRALSRYASGGGGGSGGKSSPGFLRQDSSIPSGSSSVDDDEPHLTLRNRIFLTMNDPEFSDAAKYVSLAILTLIVVSTTSFILDTRPEWEGNYVLWVIEVFCIVVFTLEYVIKVTTAPRTLEFIRQPMNVIDLAAIVPFYVEIIIIAASGGEGGNVPTGLLRLFRLFRVFRVLKLGTRMKKLEVVAAAVGDSLDMFVMLVFLLFLALVLFSTLVYFCEKDVWQSEDAVDALGGDPFASIPRSFWWCMVTLMTVGYGDSYPATIEGKLVASITMIASVLIMALPISVIGANFTQRWLVYRDDAAAKAREETMTPKFLELVDRLTSHNFVLDEVLGATEDMEVLIETEAGALREIFEEALDMEHAGDLGERHKRKALLQQFDDRFDKLCDLKRELDEVLAYAELLSSRRFTANLEACVNKNRRLDNAMDAAEITIDEVDGLVRKVNLTYEQAELTKKVSMSSSKGSPSLSRESTFN